MTAIAIISTVVAVVAVTDAVWHRHQLARFQNRFGTQLARHLAGDPDDWQDDDDETDQLLTYLNSMWTRTTDETE